MEPFRRESLKILKVFAESCPTIGAPSLLALIYVAAHFLSVHFCLTEKASIDEAYLDFTVPVRDLILERNPHLATVPPDAPLGLDTPLPNPPDIDWEPLGNVVPVLTEEDQARLDGIDAGEASKEAGEGKAEKVQAPTSSQVIARPADPINAWSDYALSIGAELMQTCRRGVLQQLGYTCSAGVARNKVGYQSCFLYKADN